MINPSEIGFNKKRVSIILGVIVFCLIVFGIGKILSSFAWLLAASPFVVIFWATVGHRVIGFIKCIKLRSTLKRSSIKKTLLSVKNKKDEETRDYLNRI